MARDGPITLCSIRSCAVFFQAERKCRFRSVWAGCSRSITSRL